MRMTDAQLAQYQRDGFLIFPALFSTTEIAALRSETARLSAIKADTVVREHSGGVRSIFRVHEDDGATRSAAFRALGFPAPAGTCVLFHCNLLHASGHNLSAEDRWHIYISFNACANAPQFTPQSRPDWVVSRNTKPLPVETDDAILELNSVLST